MKTPVRTTVEAIPVDLDLDLDLDLDMAIAAWCIQAQGVANIRSAPLAIRTTYPVAGADLKQTKFQGSRKLCAQ